MITFTKTNGKMTYNGLELKLYVEKDTDKFWWTVPKELVDELNRKHFGMKQQMFRDAEEGCTWEIAPKSSAPIRNNAGQKVEKKPNAEHWCNYLSEEDKKLYAELEARGQEARRIAYEAHKKDREKEKLEAKIKELQEMLANMSK